MLKPILLGLGAASLLVVVTAMPVQAAHITPSDAISNYLGVDPPENVISNVIYNGFSYQWVWANNCGYTQDGCGEVLEHHGFKFPTVAQWGMFDMGNVIASREALISAFTPDKSTVPPVCASMYFSLEGNSHCDVNDVFLGAIWGAPLTLADEAYVNNSNAEVFLVLVKGPVPDPNGSVPEPSSLLLLGAGLLGLAAWRWKHAA